MNKVGSVGLITCLLLLGSLLLPLYIEPYEDDTDTNFSIIPESAERFEETVEEADLDTEEAIPAEELSPKTQREFKEAAATVDQKGSEWEYFEVDVCVEQVVACDAYSEPLEFPEQGTSMMGSPYTLVEHNGKLYLINYGDSDWDVSPIIEFVVRIATLLPFSGFLMWQTNQYSDSRPQRVQRFAAYGMFLVLLGLAWPYISMFADVSLPFGLPVLLSWGGIGVGLGGYLIDK